MKKILSLFLLLSLFVSCAVPISARLSPAMGHLSEEVTLYKCGIYGKTVRFAPQDFKQALGVGQFEKITLEKLPSAKSGVLYYKNQPAKEKQALPFSEIRYLSFVPASPRVKEANFTFSAGNLVGGHTVNCAVRFLARPNAAPTVLSASPADLFAETRQNISLYGNLRAKDPEGDRLYFRIVEEPRHGKLVLGDPHTGEYRYRPDADFSGKDSFSYTVRDEYGNWSTVGETEITVKKHSGLSVFQDMKDTKAENAALCLGERNIMQGEILGSGLFFHPDREIARGEFVVMAMKSAKVSPIPGLQETYFDDNEKIPVPLRPYLATAQRHQIIHGAFTDGKLVFDSERPITRAEAAVILSRLLDVEEPEVTPTFQDSQTIPVWARPSINALYALGIYPTDGGKTQAKDVLTREDGALMLYRAIRLWETE